MTERLRGAPHAAAMALLVIGMARLPLLGAAWSGRDVTSYEEPLARLGLVAHAPTSWPVVVVGLAIVLGLAVLVAVRLVRARPERRALPGRWPWWGSIGALLTAGAWCVAWARIPMFEAIQTHTFSPLWVGYVLVVNALALRWTGDCLLYHRSFWALTATSSVFWWFFEYLNRFVESWNYEGASFDRPIDVVLFGVLPFATVLPAVMSTQDLVAGSARVDAAFARGPRVSIGRRLGALVVAAAALGLLALSWLPNVLFPLLWLAPLFILTGLQAALAKDHVFADAARGDYRLLASSAFAALVTGFFWELWNVASLAKWTYEIPYVDVLPVFEMPVLGYAGYATFGWECAAVAALVGFDGRRRFSSGVGATPPGARR